MKHKQCQDMSLRGKASNIRSEDNDGLLNQMYSRAKYKNKEETSEKVKNSVNQSHCILSDYIPQAIDSTSLDDHSQRNHYQHYGHSLPATSLSNFIKIGQKENKKEYFKTDLDNYEDNNLQDLHLQNDLLKNQLLNCQKKVAYLESYQQEAQYLKKLCFMQNLQIQKLRKIIKDIKIENIQLANLNQNSLLSCKHKKTTSHILIDEKDNMSINNLKKYKKFKCSHKNKENSRPKQKNTNRVKNYNSDNKQNGSRNPLQDILRSQKVLEYKKYSNNNQNINF